MHAIATVKLIRNLHATLFADRSVSSWRVAHFTGCCVHMGITAGSERAIRVTIESINTAAVARFASKSVHMGITAFRECAIRITIGSIKTPLVAIFACCRIYRVVTT